MKLKWRFGVVAGIFLAIFCLYPQLKMWYVRGYEWNGHYAYNDIDEVAYASYLRALIDGRPRRNDPYTGRDHTDENPQPESLFSIQFAAPYTLAIPARLLGIGTPWAMILAGAIAGFLSALFVFWLIGRLTGDPWFAMAAALGTFCFGALAAGEGAAPEIFFDGFSYPYFPGFRRYIPAMAFPAFFAFGALVWRLTTDGKMGRSRIAAYGLFAVFCFSYAVYSYFYVWTTAAAFLGCLFLVWLAARPEEWKGGLKRLAAVGGGCLASLVPYAWLLSQRSDTMDHIQLLVHTRQPDLLRFPEYIAFAVLITIFIAIVTKVLVMRDRSVLFVIALALVPFVIFNQQIVTGRSLQPIHYQVFIGNYVAALAVFFTIGLLWRSRLGQGRRGPRLASAWIALAAVIWGTVECHYTVRVLDWANERRDLGYPVAKRLEQLAASDADPHRATVLSFDGIFADDMPSVAPQNILWARHQHVFAGLNWEESKERYYQFLYYSNVDGPMLDRLLRRDFVSQIALFGWGRHTDRLSSAATPLTIGEIAEEVERYETYIENFGEEQAANPKISFVVTANDGQTEMTNLEKWYELDRGEVIGDFTLYRTRLKDAQPEGGK